jgi:hypothetical protein
MVRETAPHRGRNSLTVCDGYHLRVDQGATELTPRQQAQLRTRFDLANQPLSVVSSGWQKLVVLAGGRAFAFPRSANRVHMVEREAEVLAVWRFALAPRLLGLHRDPAVWPYPFLEMTRLEGTSWDSVKDRPEGPSFEHAAACLEELARSAATWHVMAVPSRLAVRPHACRWWSG